MKEDFYHITEMDTSQLDELLEGSQHPHLQRKWREEQDSKSVWQMFRILFAIMSFISTLIYFTAVYLMKFDKE